MSSAPERAAPIISARAPLDSRDRITRFMVFTTVLILLEICTDSWQKRIHYPFLIITRPPQSSHMTYSLLRNNTFQNAFGPFARCIGHRLHPDMQDCLNFTTSVSTDLKILFMGDSVSVQNTQTFQEAARAKIRNVLRYSWGTMVGTSTSILGHLIAVH